MRKIIAALTLVVVASFAAPVSATPSGCSTRWSGRVAASTCWSGSGRYRVYAQTSWGYFGGNCVAIGYISSVTAPVQVLYAFPVSC